MKKSSQNDTAWWLQRFTPSWARSRAPGARRSRMGYENFLHFHVRRRREASRRVERASRVAGGARSVSRVHGARKDQCVFVARTDDWM
jgi:hypothetical protein